MVTFKMSHSEPFTNRSVSGVFQTDASTEKLKELHKIICADNCLSAQKPEMLKEMLALDGYKVCPYNADIAINF